MDESLKNRTIKILQDEQNQLDDAFKPQSGGVTAPQKIEKVTVVENGDGTYTKKTEEVDSKLYDDSVVGTVEAEIKRDASTLQEFCKEFDDIIISYNVQINQKKQELVDLCSEASERNCWPGIAYTAPTAGTGLPRPLVAITNDFSSSYSIFEDREALEIYPNMAGPSANYGSDNPFIPDNIVTLTSSYSGYGYENNRDNGRLEVGDDATEIESGDYDPSKTSFQSSSNLGTGRTVSSITADHSGPRIVASAGINTSWWYAGVGVAPDATNTSLTGTDGQNRCVAIASSISTLISEIKSLRSQRESAVNRSGLNDVKEKKMEKELQDWGSENVKSKQTQRKTSNSSLISTINSMS